MKKLSLALFILGSTVALSACNGSTGYSDTQPPYGDERTAVGNGTYTGSTGDLSGAVDTVKSTAKKAERTFRDYQSK